MISADELRSRIAPLFEENFSTYGELGAALSIWHRGEPLVELHGGYRDARREQVWSADTLVLVWSATKGIGAACLLHALQADGIDLDRRVAEFWPEFGQGGKGSITIAQLLSHSAGLCVLDTPVDVLDYEAVIAALEKQVPVWLPGVAHGYHARTFGYLIDELCRRVAGISIANYWRTIFAEPLRLDFWIGLPNDLNMRVATIYAARAGGTPEPAKFYRDLLTPGTLQQRAFSSPRGLHAISAMNKPEVRAQPIVSFGGIGTASAMAKFYALLANGGELDGYRLFRPETLRLMTTTLADGVDRVLELPTAFSAGFMKQSARESIFGPSATAFGHPGAGGSHAFADPENNVSFAYVMNQMQQSVVPNEKSLRVVRVMYGLARVSLLA